MEMVKILLFRMVLVQEGRFFVILVQKIWFLVLVLGNFILKYIGS